MGSSGPALLTTLTSGISTFLTFAMEVALLVVALTMMDEARYERRGERNVVIIRKHLPAVQSQPN